MSPVTDYKPESLVVKHFARYALAGLICLACVLQLWGIQRNLPHFPEADEHSYWVNRAVGMAARGSLNPGWFGHPGSTTLYPLAGLYSLRSAVVRRAAPAWPDPYVQAQFEADPATFYLLGRLLTSAYAVASIPVIYLLGQRAFNRRIGLIGAWLYVWYPLPVAYAQLVRSDSAAVFFGMLSLWCMLKLYDTPTVRARLFTGVCIGLSISSRYLMVALVPALLIAELLIARRQRSSLGPALASTALSTAIAAAAFTLSSPYLMLESALALSSIRSEARTTHPGADGLSFAGNLAWYLGRAIPTTIGWLQEAFLLGGVGLSLVHARQQARPRVLLIFTMLFLITISLAPLHWQRWLIPVMPILALFVAHGTDGLARSITRALHAPSSQQWLVLALALALAIEPAHRTVLANLRQSQPGTRLLAGAWIARNLPEGSRIAQEWYGAPLDGAGMQVTQRFSLAEAGTPEEYARARYDYVIASSHIYDRFLQAPQRYPRETAFYTSLFSEACEVRRFTPSLTRGGPTIRIFAISVQAEQHCNQHVPPDVR